MSDVVFHPNHGDWADALTEDADEGYTNWSCKKTTAYGDLYLFYLGAPAFRIIAIGVADGVIDERVNEGQFDWTPSGKEWFCGFDPLVALDKPLLKAEIESDSTLQHWWAGKPYRGKPKAMRPEFASRMLDVLKKKNRSRRCRELLDAYSQAVVSGTSAPLITRPTATDVDEPPGRTEVVVQRIIRDTPLARQLKRIYQNTCQVCREVVQIADELGGTYAEVHHLKPLGGEHRGHDSWDNMIVVCPKCHAELDLLGIAIHPQTRKVVTIAAPDRRRSRKLFLDHEHSLDIRNLRYHWQMFHKRH